MGQKGYSALATAGTITHNIDGLQGKRIVVTSVGVTPGEVANPFYFMVPRGWTTLSAAAATAATGVTLVTDPTGMGTSDVCVIVLDDGTYQWTTIAASAVTVGHLTSTLTSSAAAGNRFYDMGVYTDDGHFRIATTASTQKVLEQADGYFYGSVKGGPMRFHFQVTSSGSSHVDFINYVFVDK
jgi:hypothetical protein